MKLSQLDFENFQMLTNISIRPTAPVLLFAGKNEQGKSSVLDGIRMSITSESSRVSLKKNYSQLVRDGAGTGRLGMMFADGRSTELTLPDGKTVHTGGTDIEMSVDMVKRQSASLPLVIDPHKFSALPENEKRSFLFNLSGLQCDGKAVSGRLLARGCDAKKIESVGTMLRAGFSAANEEAKSKAKEAKGSWKTITGETYGEKKAEGWKADSPVIDPEFLPAAKEELKKIDEVLECVQKELGALEAANAQAAKAAAQIETLKETAGKKDRIQKKLDVDRAELANWTLKVEEAKKLAAGEKPGAPLSCPHCAGLVQLLHGVMVQYEEPEHKFDPEAAANLAAYEKALALVTSAVTNGERDLKLAEEAAAKVAVLAAVEPSKEGEAAGLSVRSDALKTKRKEVQAEIEALQAKQAQANSAKEKTTKADGYHSDVKAWEKIADALAPDGIPGEMLGDALTPFNARLRETSISTGWAQVQIDPDMTLRVGGRIYTLLSESAMWRADAAVAEAISHISGLKFACFDRCDVLDIGNRSAFFKWLHRMAQDGQIDTVCCFGTFKALPGLPASTFDARWIEQGEVVTQQVAA